MRVLGDAIHHNLLGVTEKIYRFFRFDFFFSLSCFRFSFSMTLRTLASFSCSSASCLALSFSLAVSKTQQHTHTHTHTQAMEEWHTFRHTPYVHWQYVVPHRHIIIQNINRVNQKCMVGECRHEEHGRRVST